MAFTAQDALHRLGATEDQPVREIIRSTGISIEVAARGDDTDSVQKVRQLFPDVDFATSKNIVYFPMKMCHSLPNINARGRCFHPSVLQRSFATARDALIDIDHELLDNKIGNKDNICGHIKAVKYDPMNVMGEVASLPDHPVPVVALGCLFMRHSEIPEIVTKHITGKEKWGVSMECGHNFKDAAFYHKGEFIPFMDAPGQMLECVERASVKDYQGEKLSLALGGTEGQVNFWGVGITTCPADDDGEVLAMVAGSSMELANSTGKKYFPIHFEQFSGGLEVANEGVDKTLNELANITIIGKTEPAEDGHTHDLLSDGTVLPTNGHTHYLDVWNLSPGRKPGLTGRTGTHYDGTRDSLDNYREVVHLHLINIDLRAKPTSVSGAGDEDTDSEVSHVLGEDEVTKFTELLDRMEKALSNGNGNSDSQQSNEVASVLAELRKFKDEENIERAIADGVDEKLKSGDYVTKEELKKQVDDAVKKANDEADVKLEGVKKQTERRESVTALGLNLEAVIEEDDDETIGEVVDSFGVDEDGDKQFGRYYKTLKKIATDAKEKEGKEKEKEAAEAANKKPKERPPLLVGGGPTDNGSETASKGSGSGDESVKIGGKKAMSRFKK